MVVALGVVALLGATSRDSVFGRRRVAKRLFDAAADVRQRRSEEETYRRAAYELKHTARFGHRFGSCYAVTLLGDLALELSPPDKDFVATIAECLDRDDPFVRHAAAAALYRQVTLPKEVQDTLSRTAERYPDESSGELAKRASRLRG